MYDLTFLDVSQFVLEPQRTGVQRVLAKAIEFLPRTRIMPFCVLDEHRVAILAPALFDLIPRYFQAQTPSARSRVAAAPGPHTPISTEELTIKLLAERPLAVLEAARFFARAKRILNLEAFSRSERSRFYISCGQLHRRKVFHFVHDFLLFEAPEVFPQLNWRYASDYVLLFEAYAAAGGLFVSTPDMARKVTEYFNRPLAEVKVVHFGGDLHAAAFGTTAGDAEHRKLTVIGTIEPRKYPLVVAESLDRVARADPTLDCAMVGAWGWVEPDTRAAIEAVFARGRVRHLGNIGDAELTARMRASDLGIYVSSAEGFGLPVIEFAAAGIPLITNAAVPAAALLGGATCTVLDQVDEKTLTAAIDASLKRAHARKPYYDWTWKNCAAEIFDWDPHGDKAREGGDSSLEHWRATMAWVRELRVQILGWEELKREVRARLSRDKRLAPPAKSAGAGEAALQLLVENISEIISDNLTRIFWADLLQIKPLLAELVRCLSAENYLDGISRAFILFLGREIDGRAASEAVRLRDTARAFARMVELVFSEEAAAALGEPRATALRAVVKDIEPIVAASLDEHLDLFRLTELLGLPAPNLADVLKAESLAASERDRLQLLLFLADRRALAGDSLDLFLEEVARATEEKRLEHAAIRIQKHKLNGTQATTAAPATTGAPAIDGAQAMNGARSSNDAQGMNGAQPMNGAQTINDAPPLNGAYAANGADAGTLPLPAAHTEKASGSASPDSLPESPTREVPMHSDPYWTGWHSVECTGADPFRWMGKEGVIHNPSGARPVRGLVLDIRNVYGADEPMAACFMGNTATTVNVESGPNGKGWRLYFDADGDAVYIDSVRLQALMSDSPARAEGLPDGRELSLCVTGATFVYGD
jgi:hypothetical protein